MVCILDGDECWINSSLIRQERYSTKDRCEEHHGWDILKGNWYKNEHLYKVWDSDNVTIRVWKQEKKAEKIYYSQEILKYRRTDENRESST